MGGYSSSSCYHSHSECLPNSLQLGVSTAGEMGKQAGDKSSLIHFKEESVSKAHTAVPGQERTSSTAS